MDSKDNRLDSTDSEKAVGITMGKGLLAQIQDVRTYEPLTLEKLQEVVKSLSNEKGATELIRWGTDEQWEAFCKYFDIGINGNKER